MNARGVLLVVVGVLCAVAFVVWRTSPPSLPARLAPAPRELPAQDDSVVAGSEAAPRRALEPEELSATSARSSAAVESVAAERVPVGTGSIRGVLLDEHDAPVTGATISHRRGGSKVSVTVGTADAGPGTYAFEELPPGRYQLMVEPRSLRHRFLPPWAQQAGRRYTGTPTGFGGTVVFLEEGSHEVVDLRVFRPSRISGRVLDVRGQPVSNAVVHFASADGVLDAGVTALDGEYEVGRVYPGEYTAFVLRIDGESCGVRAPTPISFRLSPGELRRLPDLIVGGGELSIVGRVVDGSGRPLAGASVECREGEDDGRPVWRALTDREGYYALGGLLPLQVIVTFHRNPSERRQSRRSRGGLLGAIEPIDVDLRFATDTIDLGETVFEHSEPFSVAGRIEIDKEWAAANDLGRFDVRIVSDEPGRALVAATNDPLRLEGSYNSERRTFSWSCRTPSPPMELAVILTGEQGTTEGRVVPVVPRAGDREEVVVFFP